MPTADVLLPWLPLDSNGSMNAFERGHIAVTSTPSAGRVDVQLPWLAVDNQRLIWRNVNVDTLGAGDMLPWLSLG